MSFILLLTSHRCPSSSSSCLPYFLHPSPPQDPSWNRGLGAARAAGTTGAPAQVTFPGDVPVHGIHLQVPGLCAHQSAPRHAVLCHAVLCHVLCALTCHAMLPARLASHMPGYRHLSRQHTPTPVNTSRRCSSTSLPHHITLGAGAPRPSLPNCITRDAGSVHPHPFLTSPAVLVV